VNERGILWGIIAVLLFLFIFSFCRSFSSSVLSTSSLSPSFCYSISQQLLSSLHFTVLIILIIILLKPNLLLLQLTHYTVYINSLSYRYRGLSCMGPTRVMLLFHSFNSRYNTSDTYDLKQQ